MIIIIVKNKKNKKTYWIVKFAVSADYRVNLKENDKRGQF